MTGPAVPVTTRARDLLASEWTKLRSVRSTYLALLGSAAVAVGVGIFSAATVKTSHIDWATFDPVNTSLSGLLIVQLVFGVFGALAITSEHATGMIRTTFAAVPRRRAVLAAKATVTGAAGIAAGELIAFAAFFSGQLVLSGKHLHAGQLVPSGKHLSITIADPGVLRAVAGAGFYLFIVTLVGLGLGAIIRHTAGAIAAVGLIFVQALIVNLVFPDPNSAAGHYVLLWAGQSISSLRAHVTNYPSVPSSFAICIAYAAVLLAAASFLITRRDA
jgi:ABC-2 type transport system permease protein